MAALILLILFVLAWVVLILPRQRELRRHQRLMGQLVVGDEVMMSSGIYGTIVELDGDYARLEIADGVTVKIARRSIAATVAEPTPPRDGEPEIGQTDPAEGGIEGGVGSDGGSRTEVGQTDAAGDDDGGDQSADLDPGSVSEHERRPGNQADGGKTEGELDDELDRRKGNEA